jgi:hypothetical protein
MLNVGKVVRAYGRSNGLEAFSKSFGVIKTDPETAVLQVRGEWEECNVIFINCKWVFTRWQWFTIRHNKQITHHTK